MSVRTWSDEEFVQAHSECDSVADLLRRLGLSVHGQSYETVKRACERLNLSYPANQGAHSQRNAGPRFKRDLNFYLRDGVKVKSHYLRQRLIAEGRKEDRCEGCGLDSWRGGPIPLELDHVNGNNRDNRIENLRVLCPNCHALTPTWRGRNRKVRTVSGKSFEYGRKYPEEAYLCECGSRKGPTSNVCSSCWNTPGGRARRSVEERTVRKTKIQWPTDEWLIERLKTTSYVGLGRELGVSDVAIRKRLGRRK